MLNRKGEVSRTISEFNPGVHHFFFVIVRDLGGQIFLLQNGL